MERDPYQRVRDALAPFTIKVDAWLMRTAALAEGLRAVTGTRTAGEVESCVLLTFSIDRRTLKDFVAFDGTIDTVTDRMLAYFHRRASGLN